MAKKVSVEAVTLFQLSVALFIATLGILGIAYWRSDVNEFGRQLNRFFGARNDPTNLVVAIVELVCGIVVAFVMLLKGKSRLPSLLTLVVAALWLVYSVVTLVSSASESDFVFVKWLNTLALDLAILMGLWMVNRRYA